MNTTDVMDHKDSSTREKLLSWRERLPGTKVKGDRIIQMLIFCKISLQEGTGNRVFRKAEDLYIKVAEDPELQQILKEGDSTDELADLIYESCLIYVRSCREDDSYGRKFFNIIRMKAEEVAEKAGLEIYHLLIPFFFECRDTAMRIPFIQSLHRAYQEMFPDSPRNCEDYLQGDSLQLVSLREILSQTPTED